MGLFDDAPKVSVDLWTRSRLPWEPAVDGAAQLEKGH
jgi:hypothetical protein